MEPTGNGSSINEPEHPVHLRCNVDSLEAPVKSVLYQLQCLFMLFSSAMCLQHPQVWPQAFSDLPHSPAVRHIHGRLRCSIHNLLDKPQEALDKGGVAIRHVCSLEKVATVRDRPCYVALQLKLGGLLGSLLQALRVPYLLTTKETTISEIDYKTRSMDWGSKHCVHAFVSFLFSSYFFLAFLFFDYCS